MDAVGLEDLQYFDSQSITLKRITEIIDIYLARPYDLAYRPQRLHRDSNSYKVILLCITRPKSKLWAYQKTRLYFQYIHIDNPKCSL